MIEFARISIGTGGAAICSQCQPQTAILHAPDDEILSKVKRVALSADGTVGPNVLLEGPEPFRHPNLPALLGGALAAGIERIALVTDAGALGVADNASGSIFAGLRHIHVPLFGSDSRSHDALTHSGTFDASCAGVARFRSAAERMGIEVLVIGVLPLCVHNLTDAAETVAVFAKLGAAAVRIIGDDTSASRPHILAACETGMVNGVWVWHEGDPTSRQGALADHRRGPIRLAEVAS
ncbi:MAG: hypothetical protein KJ747_01190 [Actinobacteria bacterium]|nr:hypothetical protein [Actinomycetota bacterium]MCG2806642.1 hypothetical protein [Coriobacteriia bacterium]